MVNKVTLIGNLGKAPEVRKLENGATVARFSLATNENYRDKSGEWQTNTEWHNVTCWNKLAEKVESFEKGSLVYLEGKITYRKYEDKDGNSRTATEVVASYVRYVSKPVSQERTSEPAPEPVNVPAGDEDLPF